MDRMPLGFPLGGLVENAPFTMQPPQTSPALLNVMPYDTEKDRSRGGQRAGLGLYYPDPIDSEAIRHLNQITRIVNANAIIQGEVIYSRSFNDAPQPYPLGASSSDSSEWGHSPTVVSGTHPRLYDTQITSGSFRYIRDNDHVELDLSNNYNSDGTVNSATDFDDATNMGRSIRWSAAGSTFDRDAQFIVTSKVTTIVGDNDADYFWGITIRLKVSDNECFLCGWHKIAGGANFEIGCWKEEDSGSTVIGTPSSPVAADALQHDLEVRVNKYYVEIYWDGVLRYQQTLTTGNGFDSTAHKQIGWGFYRKLAAGVFSPNLDAPIGDNLKVYDALQPTTGRETKLIVVSNTNIYAGTKQAGFGIPTGGTGALTLDGSVMSQVIFQKLYFVDDGSNWKVYDPATNAVTSVAASAGSLPGSAGHRPTIIALWNARAVYAGLESEPHNWFMSRQFQNVGDETDFDYTQVDVGAAVAGNNAEIGQIGDIITAVIPYTRGPLVFGCQKEVWVLSGNPGPGGVASLTRLMDKVGIVGRRAWCIDPRGQMYFMGTDGFYQMTTDGLRIDRVNVLSLNKLDKTLRSINVAANDIKLIWSEVNRGVFIFITPIESGQTLHYFWSSRTNGFFPIQIPNDSGPTAVLNYVDDDPASRSMIVGGFDSYLREFQPDLKYDHGTPHPFAIESLMQTGPFRFAREVHARSKLMAVEGQMADSTDQYTLEVVGSESAEGLVDAQATVSRLMTGGGRMARINKAVSAKALAIRISNDVLGKTWAMEHLVLWGTDVGANRKAVVQ